MQDRYSYIDVLTNQIQWPVSACHSARIEDSAKVHQTLFPPRRWGLKARLGGDRKEKEVQYCLFDQLLLRLYNHIYEYHCTLKLPVA